MFKSIVHKFSIAIAVLAVNSAAAQNVTVSARLDSTRVTMGDRVVLHVEVTKNGHQGAIANLPTIESGKVTEFGRGIEVREINSDSTNLGNGRTQLNYNIVLQAFEPDSLPFVFPPFKYVVDRDTFESNTVMLRVDEVAMPKEMRDSAEVNPFINPMEGVSAIPGRWYDIVPDWWNWVVIAIALAALGVVVYLLYKKNGPGLLPRKRVILPYPLAVSRLNDLKRRKLAESGNDKEYYTELTDILRQYLEGRFGVQAREMTSTQIIEAMQSDSRIANEVEALVPMFETADFVKFAKMHAPVDENTRSFGLVRSFVERTKPVEEDPDANSGRGARRRKAKQNKNKKK